MQGRFEHRDTSSFAAGQRPRDVEPFLRQKIVQIVTRNAPRNFRITLANERRVFVPQRFQLAVNLAARTAVADDAFELVFARRANPHPSAIVSEDFQFMQVVGGACARPGKLRHDGVNAARVVADHPADGAMVMRGRVGPKGEPMRLRRLPHTIEHNSRPRRRESFLRIDRDELVKIFRHVHHDRDVAALSGQARAAAARQNGRAMAPRGQDNLGDVLHIARDHDADRHLAIVRTIGRVKRATAIIKADFAADFGAQLGGQFLPVTVIAVRIGCNGRSAAREVRRRSFGLPGLKRGQRDADRCFHRVD